MAEDSEISAGANSGKTAREFQGHCHGLELILDKRAHIGELRPHLLFRHTRMHLGEAPPTRLPPNCNRVSQYPYVIAYPEPEYEPASVSAGLTKARPGLNFSPEFQGSCA